MPCILESFCFRLTAPAYALASFAYDPDGARITKTTPSGTTRYNSADLEITPTGDAIKYPHPDVKRTTSGSTSTNTWLRRNHLNSVRVVINTTGNGVERSIYTAYGDRQNNPAPTKGFIGERHDPETGLLYALLDWPGLYAVASLFDCFLLPN